MINSIRSERGWRGRRRIAVLISLVGVLGIISLGSASSASAALLCKGSVAPKSKGNPGKEANLSFSCAGGPIRAYGVISSKTITGYSSPPLVSGAASPYFNCEGSVPGSGFGCGIKDRAIATDGTGTQTPGATPNGGSTTSCGISTTVLPAVPMGAPAVNNITGKPCLQLIPAGAVVAQDVTLASDPCKYKRSEPLRMFMTAGEEPPVSSFTVRGDSYNVGAFETEPFLLKVKGYAGCQPDAKEAKAKKKSASAAAAGDNLYPAFCAGKVESKDPAKPSIDMKYEFACNIDVRGYAITSNKKLDFFGFESEVHKPNGAISDTESALVQCNGPVPGYGFGCGVTNRQNSTGCGPTVGNDPGEDLCVLTAGNTLVAELGVPESPCKREPGEARQKIWLTVFGEVPVDNPNGGPKTTGEYISEPFVLPITGYSRGACAKLLKASEKGNGGKKK